MKKKITDICKRSIKRLSNKYFKAVIIAEIERRMNDMPPDDALRFILDLDNTLYNLEGSASIRYGNGIHTKHRHIRYHEFFKKNIEPGSRVLDVGCGNGSLAADIAENVPEVYVYGIDISIFNIETAQKKYSFYNVTFICGNALYDLPDDKFDVIVLSNVLEHIEKRVEFLSLLKDKYNPKKILIRVPLFDRDWRVPLKKELGIEYRLDKSHFTEYFFDDFSQEMTEAGLVIVTSMINWGEIWAVAAEQSVSHGV